MAKDEGIESLALALAAHAHKLAPLQARLDDVIKKVP